jgi:hypothetical protein
MRYAALRHGLVGAWCPSLGATGYTLLDRSGYGNHGTLVNMDAGTDWVGGPYGTALDFDGVNDYVAQPLKSGSTIDHTQSVWFSTQRTTYQYLLALEGFCSPPNTWNLIRIDITNASQVAGYVFDGSSIFIGSTTVTVNTWTHAAMTRSGNVFQFYVNGRLTGSGSYTPFFISSSPTVNDIGARRNLPTATPFFGQIDDVRFYDRALTFAEIRLLASEPGIGLKPERTSVYFGESLSSRRRKILTGLT